MSLSSVEDMVFFFGFRGLGFVRNGAGLVIYRWTSRVARVQAATRLSAGAWAGAWRWKSKCLNRHHIEHSHNFNVASHHMAGHA